MSIAPTVTPLAAAAYARLDAIANLATYLGAPPDDTDVATIAGSTLAAPYAVLYPGGGRSGDVDGSGEPVTLGGDLEALTWSFQITCAAGPLVSCMWAIDKVREAFTYGAPLAVTGLGLGQVFDDYDGGPIPLDRTPDPPRFYLPMIFRLAATRGD